MENPAPRKKFSRLSKPFSFIYGRTRAHAPSLPDCALAALSSALLVFSFPDFNFWPLAWVGLVPLIITVSRREMHPLTAFFLGWLTSTLFFYASCYWITYSMIRYGGIPTPIAYLLVLPPSAIISFFPALAITAFAFLFHRRHKKIIALISLPFLWTASEIIRLYLIGQLWNALGYSQTYVPQLIQAARWGGVYAVGFLLVTLNSALAYLLLERTRRSLLIFSLAIIFVGAILALSFVSAQRNLSTNQTAEAVVVGVQANVPMSFERSTGAMEDLLQRHFWLSERALRQASGGNLSSLPRVVVWSESPMNFAYSRDAAFRTALAEFARRNHAAVIINSVEPAADDGVYNSALMINDEGRLVSQYDKIRLLPFGEFVPIPKWVPGAGMVAAVVGDFTPGEKYPLLSFGPVRAGLFICFESAFPEVAREFAAQGADVFINISNDGYFGPTPVRRQHLANAVFRAVENARPVLRVTNTGISARITAEGKVLDATSSFQPEVRTWTIGRSAQGKTFYTVHGDLFAVMCVMIGCLFFFLPKTIHQV